MPIDNIDTDQLIPARFMSVPRSAGYGTYLLHDMRRDGDGTLLPEFPLNGCAGARILIAGRNFGTGSSREAAVYALVDAGFVAVIAPSFGDIFASNAVNNGLLPACLSLEQIDALGDGIDGRIDLETCRISIGGQNASFDLDEVWRRKLINGWDDIDLTLQHAPQITAFRAAHMSKSGAWPTSETKR